MGNGELFPEDLMMRALASRPCAGTFEAHVTVEASDADARDRFRGLCAELAVKPVLIELPAGKSPSQPMTGSYHRGTAQLAAEEVASVARRLRGAGFPVTRVKLEAVATNDGVPETDGDAAAFPAGCYFEFHVKLALPVSADLAALRAVCERFGARLSRNAFKHGADGRTERFVTLRLYGVGRTSAFANLAALEAELAAAGFEVVNRQREYCLFDSHVGLDAGWLDIPSVPS